MTALLCAASLHCSQHRRVRSERASDASDARPDFVTRRCPGRCAYRGLFAELRRGLQPCTASREVVARGVSRLAPESHGSLSGSAHHPLCRVARHDLRYRVDAVDAQGGSFDMGAGPAWPAAARRRHVVQHRLAGHHPAVLRCVPHRLVGMDESSPVLDVAPRCTDSHRAYLRVPSRDLFRDGEQTGAIP